jgi:hypothetical protein
MRRLRIATTHADIVSVLPLKALVVMLAESFLSSKALNSLSCVTSHESAVLVNTVT